jgi:hypothetical protein
MSMRDVLVNDFVDALGGTGAVAQLLGITPTAVSNMRRRGAIPPRFYYQLEGIARARRLRLNKSMFWPEAAGTST